MYIDMSHVSPILAQYQIPDFECSFASGAASGNDVTLVTSRATLGSSLNLHVFGWLLPRAFGPGDVR